MVYMNETLTPFSIEAKSLVKGAIYQHYSGKQYKLIAYARHSEDLEEYVVYQALYGENDVWIRPLKMFLETVTINGNVQPRFKPLSP